MPSDLIEPQVKRLNFKDMIMEKKLILILVLLAFVLSCKKSGEPISEEEVTPPVVQNIISKNITTSSFTEVSNSTVGLSGATVKISKPNTPADGIEIVIPANSYTSSQSLKVSYAEIKSHQFGANFNPISPIISVILDGGYSNELISITIPVKIPSGHIPLGFFLDETTGKLEGIPFKSITANSITLLTRHFLNANKLKSGELNLKNLSGIGANIIISSISESILNGQPIIASGFKPGTDDWEFVNYGSYTATGGHCSGQNMAAMWYYFEKKPTLGSLYNKYSDNPNLWNDNARGYRFCSVIFNDLDWDGTVTTLFGKYIDKNQALDKLKLLTIAGTMLVTGEPQGIGIYRQSGTNTDGTPSYTGHDLICYQVSVSGGKLYISDPNTPGTQQTINFSNDKFSPYIAKTNGNAPATPYQYVTYYAKTAYIEWAKIGKRWDELVNNTIGTIAPNTFPSYTIWVKDKTSDVELKDGMTVTRDTLSTYVECPTAVERVTVNGKRLISSEVFGTDGFIKSKQNIPGVTNWSLSTGQYVKLTPGLNKLGYAIIGWNAAALYTNSTARIPLYIDFKWITVDYAPLRITADQAEGVPAKEVKFTALSNGTAPKSAKYVWNFGDGTAAVSKTNDSTALHTFAKEGIYTVSAELFDNSTNTKRASASLSFNVAANANILNVLKKCKKIEIWFNGDHRDKNGYAYNRGNIGLSTYETDFQGTIIKDAPVVWSGNTCTATWSAVSPPASIYKTSLTFQMKITVSPDGKTVLDFSADELYSWEWAATKQSSITTKALAGKNVPLKIPQPGDNSVSYQFDGTGVQSLLTKVSGSYVPIKSGYVQASDIYSNTNWNSKEDPPSLGVSFY